MARMTKLKESKILNKTGHLTKQAVLKSRKIIASVVDSLQLDISYTISGRVIEREVYQRESPIKMTSTPASDTNLAKVES